MADIISGQNAVASAGTAELVAAAGTKGEAFAIKALPGNTGVVYIGNDGAGDVTSANGYALSAGDQVLVEATGRGMIDLGDVWVDAATSGDGVSWLRIR